MRVFVDTSVFFKWLYWFFRYWKLKFLEEIFKIYEFVISNYVINELLEKREKISKDLSEKDFLRLLWDFLNLYSVDIIKTNLVPLDSNFFDYVNDINDTQILYDAVKAKADILFTNNIKDFKIDKIEKDFKIKVVDRLEFV